MSRPLREQGPRHSATPLNEALGVMPGGTALYLGSAG